MRNAGQWSAVACSSLLLLVACSSTSGGNGNDGGPTGGVCSSGCSGGLSCMQNSDFPTGACTAVCNPGSCPSGTACSPMLSTGSSYCLQTCGGASQCPASLSCTTTAVGNLCLTPTLPVASGISCPAPTLVVGTPAGPSTDPGCRTPVVTSALPPADVQRFGTHSPGDTLSFQVPAGAVGFSIISQAVTTPNPFVECETGPGQFTPITNAPVPTPILTPQGAVFFDDSANLPADETTALLLFFLVGGQAPFAQALNFPNTTAGLALSLDGGLPGGAWSFDVSDYARELPQVYACDGGTMQNTYDVSVVVTPGPATSTSTAPLAADVYLVTEMLDAGFAVNSPNVQRFVRQYANFYAQAGVCVSTVTFHDVPLWAINKYSSLPSVDDTVTEQPCSDFRQMMTLAEPGRTMALFFVDELAPIDAQGDQIVGKDGSIPGMGTFNGTIIGGSAVSVADLNATGNCSTALDPAACGPDEVADIAGHETGHFLGLYHPTEETGDVFDPLADTATCVCALCETGAAAQACSNNPDGGLPTLVSNDVCSGATQQCGGANLLMFWILTTSSEGQLTPQEAAVIRANPLLSAP
ncbi:MAG: hypothetical protein ACLPJH_04695 [Myxococcaceae bacterium]